MRPIQASISQQGLNNSPSIHEDDVIRDVIARLVGDPVRPGTEKDREWLLWKRFYI